MQTNKNNSKPMPGEPKPLQPVGDSQNGMVVDEMELPASPAQGNIQAAKHVETGHVKTPGEVAMAEKDAKKKKASDAKAGKYTLRVKMSHPNQKFQLGRHSISAQYQTYDLNQAEAAELSTEGPAHWLEIGDAKKEKADAELRKGMNAKNLDSQAL